MARQHGTVTGVRRLWGHPRKENPHSLRHFSAHTFLQSGGQESGLIRLGGRRSRSASAGRRNQPEDAHAGRGLGTEAAIRQ